MKICAPLKRWLLLTLVITACKRQHLLEPAPVENHMQRGEDAVVQLPEDHREGATWQLSTDFDHTKIVSMNTVWHGNEKGIYFHLRAVGTGSTSLTFIKRKFTDTLELKKFHIRIRSLR